MILGLTTSDIVFRQSISMEKMISSKQTESFQALILLLEFSFFWSQKYSNLIAFLVMICYGITPINSLIMHVDLTVYSLQKIAVIVLNTDSSKGETDQFGIQNYILFNVRTGI